MHVARFLRMALVSRSLMLFAVGSAVPALASPPTVGGSGRAGRAGPPKVLAQVRTFVSAIGRHTAWHGSFYAGAGLTGAGVELLPHHPMLFALSGLAATVAHLAVQNHHINAAVEAGGEAFTRGRQGGMDDGRILERAELGLAKVEPQHEPEVLDAMAARRGLGRPPPTAGR